MRGILVTLTLLALALPAAADAQEVPPGNSGVDQYRESIPGAGGARPTGPSVSGGGSASGTDAATGESRISPSTTKSLEKLGPDGKATAAAAAATAPSRPQSSGGSDGSGRTGGSESSGDSDPGMGWALPAILALTLAGAVAAVMLRRRGGTPAGPA